MASAPRVTATYGADYILRAVRIVDVLLNDPDSADTEETLWAIRQLIDGTNATKATVKNLLSSYEKEIQN